MTQPKILKFGGSCLGTPEALRRCIALVRQELPQGGVVVASALEGMTDALSAAMALALSGDEGGMRQRHLEVVARHWAMARELGVEAEVRPHWEPLLARLQAKLEGISLVWEASPRTRDAVLTLGETLSTHLLMASLLRERVAAHFVDAGELILTDGRHGRARPRLEAIREACEPLKSRLLKGECILTQGFVGQSPEGEATTLGRGGSDTTATLLGEALGAREVQIWINTDGILTADPSLVPEAQLIPQLSLAELSALSAFGAKVLQSEALAPVARGGFPLVVANSQQPEHRTEVRSGQVPPTHQAITSVAYKEGLVCVDFGSERDLERILSIALSLQEAGAVRYGLVESPEGTLLVVRPDQPEASALLRRLKGEGLKVEGGWAVVALVGEGLRYRPGHALSLLARLVGERIGGLLAGGEGISAAVLVREERLPVLIPELHRLCF